MNCSGTTLKPSRSEAKSREHALDDGIGASIRVAIGVGKVFRFVPLDRRIEERDHATDVAPPEGIIDAASPFRDSSWILLDNGS